MSLSRRAGRSRKDLAQTKEDQGSRNTCVQAPPVTDEDVCRPPDSDSGDASPQHLTGADNNSGSESSESDKHSIRRTIFDNSAPKRKKPAATYSSSKRLKPGKGRRGLNVPDLPKDLEHSPTKARRPFRRPSLLDDDDDGASDSTQKLNVPISLPDTPEKKRSAPRLQFSPRKKGDTVEREKSPEPTFKTLQLPGALSHEDVSYLSDVPGSSSSEKSDSSDGEDDQKQNDFESTPVCPQCLAPVSEELFAHFSKNGRVDEEIRAKFCRIHTTNTARGTFRSKGYPKIDWESLETRLREYDSLVKRLLSGEEKSYYATQLQAKLKSGEGRLIRKENLTPGYYGPRGLRIMSEYLVGRFSEDLRKHAVENYLVSARGNMSYIQTVIIPEITVEMMMKDMDISQEEARMVFVESKEVGDLLNEDQGDIVSSDEEDVDGFEA